MIIPQKIASGFECIASLPYLLKNEQERCVTMELLLIVLNPCRFYTVENIRRPQVPMHSGQELCGLYLLFDLDKELPSNHVPQIRNSLSDGHHHLSKKQ